ncbi:MAG TPA: hypothetical protein VMU18_06365 [Rhodoblastus sp.]|nr:hypothetical protein [Rhodoblastus sp.]
MESKWANRWVERSPRQIGEEVANEGGAAAPTIFDGWFDDIASGPAPPKSGKISEIPMPFSQKEACGHREKPAEITRLLPFAGLDFAHIGEGHPKHGVGLGENPELFASELMDEIFSQHGRPHRLPRLRALVCWK